MLFIHSDVIGNVRTILMEELSLQQLIPKWHFGIKLAAIDEYMPVLEILQRCNLHFLLVLVSFLEALVFECLIVLIRNTLLNIITQLVRNLLHKSVNTI